MFGQRDRIIRSLARRRVLVFPRDGGALDGLLLDADHGTLRLGDVHRRTDGVSVTVPGEVYIDRAHVAYLQIVGDESAVG